MDKYFCIDASNYAADRSFEVYRPSSLNHPKSNSVMFITEQFIDKWESLLTVNNCIVYWPQNEKVPATVAEKHIVIVVDDPRKGFAQFFYENGIKYYHHREKCACIDGAWIEDSCTIGDETEIFPGAYVGGDAKIGNNCYIASGVRIIGKVEIGDNCIIRENTVIGADGLTTRRNNNGKVMTIPQFGGVLIMDNVQIGANCVICRGAIDDTIIRAGSRIDNCCFISHNVEIGEDCLVVGETLMMGSSKLGDRVYISGNSTVRDGVSIGDETFIGMGSVVNKDIPKKVLAYGVPAKINSKESAQ